MMNQTLIARISPEWGKASADPSRHSGFFLAQQLKAAVANTSGRPFT